MELFGNWKQGRGGELVVPSWQRTCRIRTERVIIELYEQPVTVFAFQYAHSHLRCT